MSKICNLLGIKTKNMVDFPSVFQVRHGIIEGNVWLEVFNEFRPEYCVKPYRSNEKAVARALWKINNREDRIILSRYDDLIEHLRRLHAKSLKRHGRLSIELRFITCNGILYHDIVFYRGKVNRKLIKEFEEFKNKEEK